MCNCIHCRREIEKRKAEYAAGAIDFNINLVKSLETGKSMPKKDLFRESAYYEAGYRGHYIRIHLT